MSEPVVIAQQKVALRDPQDCTDQADDLALLEAMFDALVRRGPDGRYKPALARDWTLSEDARRWTFRLKPGLKFHDGSPLDAAAMKFSIERMRRPDVGATLGAPAVWGQYLGAATVEAPDAETVVVETAEPTADLLDILVSGYALPPHAADSPDFRDRPIGSGAYLATDVAAGEIRMAANPDWHGGAAPNAELVWRATPDLALRTAAVPTGRAHVATRLAPDAPGVLAHVDPVAIIYLLNAAAGPFRDPRLRLAMNLAVDRAAIIEGVLGGAGTPLTGYLSTNHVGVDLAAAADARRGPDGARRLLQEAGYGDGLTLDVDCPTSLPDEAEALTAAVQGQLAPFGVRLNVRRHTDRVAYAEMVRDKGIGDMCVFDSSPMSAFRVVYEKLDSRQPGAWRQGYGDAEVETLLDQARRTPDAARREEVYKAVYRRLQENPAWLCLYNRKRGVALAGGHGDWRMRADGVLDVTTLPKFAG